MLTSNAGVAVDIRRALEEHGIDYRDKGKELWVECPWCRSPDWVKTGTASVNAESGAFRCLHANRCGQKGSFREFCEKHGFKTGGQSDRVFTHTPPVKSYTRPARPTADDSVGALATAYFQTRKISAQTVTEYAVQGTLVQGKPAIAFPCFENGDVVNVKYRVRDGSNGKPPWKNFVQTKNGKPCLWGKQLVPASAKMLIVTEGEIDCMTAHQLGGNASGHGVVSMPAGASNIEWIELDWDWLQQFTTIAVATDCDKGGDEAAVKIVERLGRAKCVRVKFPKKDLNECLVSLNWTTAEFYDAIKNAEEYRPEHLVSADEMTDKVLYPRAEDLEREIGVPTPWAGLDEKLKGWRKGETTVITGLNGCGKSTALYQIVVDLVKRGRKCCVGSFETPPALYLRRMLVMASGSKATPEQRLAAWNWLKKGLYIINLVEVISPAKLLEIFQYSAQRYAVEFCITDSLMCLDIATDDYNGQKTFVVKAKAELCQRHDVHHFLVAHPRKGTSDHTTGQDRVDVGGSGHITNLADNVITFLRDNEGKKPTKMRLLKNRLHGVTGTIDLSYDQSFNAFRQVEAEVAEDDMPDYRHQQEWKWDN